MTMIDQTRMNIINIIMSIDNIERLTQIEQKVSDVKAQIDVMDAVTQVRPSITLDEIAAEQNYRSMKYQEFRTLADNIGIEEPIEDLLGMLTK